MLHVPSLLLKFENNDHHFQKQVQKKKSVRYPLKSNYNTFIDLCIILTLLFY